MGPGLENTLMPMMSWVETKDSQAQVKKKVSLTLSTTEISTDKPAGPAAMPENLTTEPVGKDTWGTDVDAIVGA